MSSMHGHTGFMSSTFFTHTDKDSLIPYMAEGLWTREHHKEKCDPSLNCSHKVPHTIV